MPARAVRSVGLLVALALTVLAAPAGASRVVERWTAIPQIGGIAVDGAGRIFTVDENTDTALILRAYRPDGTQRWRRSWRPRGASLSAGDVAIGPGGMLLVSGAIRPDPAGKCDEIWTRGWALAAWGRDGRRLWQRTEPGWRTCETFATSGSSVAAGGSMVALVVRTGDEYGQHAWLLAFDLSGRHRWRYEFPFGRESDAITDVAVGAEGAVYLAGTFNISYSESPRLDPDAVLVKLRADGSTAWRRVVRGHRHRAERAGHVTLTPGAVAFSSLEGHGRPGFRVASFTRDTGRLRWDRFAERVVGSGWGDGFLGTVRAGPVVATSQRDAEGLGVHILVRAYGPGGSIRWTRHLHRPDRSRVATGLAASDALVVVVGRPKGQAGDWSDVWVLLG